MAAEMKTPVSVLRLPRGPDPNSRGFDPSSPRFIALCPTSISACNEPGTDAGSLQTEQHARSMMRERFLRCLLSMANKQIQFDMYERVKVKLLICAGRIVQWLWVSISQSHWVRPPGLEPDA
ncbi:Gem-associated protein 7 [Merluccius polli]|uniref:Gem-associated protein 7 n=1 Tax=Merluccius polli TaxID=89951 RepID=A0AA47N7X2_MERPO|nr:Gem-associated protein 7 [Merluccius polli]